MISAHYTKDFYEDLREGARRSAEVILRIVLDRVPVRSVVDVGCGDGTWLAVVEKLGVADVFGIDGEYVGRDILQFPQSCFQSFDLSKPFELTRRFDLAISLEVAEHLPKDCAAGFIESITRMAPAVLFSAAIPSQGGNNHINEQWPDKWAELFKQHNYLPVDFIRKRVWQNETVEWWYAQNTLLFAHTDLVKNNPALKDEFEQTNLSQLCLVHPRKYLEITAAPPPTPAPSGVREASRLLFVCLRNAIIKRANFFTRMGPLERP
jgi:SAM-dependent methyltransferase